jgi:cobaltochelatase CobN
LRWDRSWHIITPVSSARIRCAQDGAERCREDELTKHAARERRNLVVRADGRVVNVARPRGQLFVCATGCCCGRTGDGFAAVPTELYHHEWERRRLRNVVHLTIAGCLGPCTVANVVLLLFDGQALWFHSMDSEAQVRALYDHVEALLEADQSRPVPPALASCQFTASAWQPRPDGQPLDDTPRPGDC